MTKCDGCIFDNTCVDCNDFDCGELEALLKEHDKQIRKQVIKEIKEAMYHEAFEVSHEEDGLQKWDSGNWIRYKLFERVMKQLKE